LNGTIPFLLGADLHAWTQSPVKSVLFSFFLYSILFLVIPLVIVKGWKTVRQPAFLLPLGFAVVAITVWRFIWGSPAIAVLVLACLHARFDLSELGFRSLGWKGDLVAILLIGLLGAVPALLQSGPHSFSIGSGLQAAAERLFANPASSMENLFYFGFLTERLSYRFGTRLTPFLIGLMYTTHEMTNPEYWYGGTSFVLILIGVTIWAAIYLARRNVVAIWLGDGLYRFVGKLF
jgi:hypothetical protein